MKTENQKIEIPLSNGYKLIAEQSTDPDFPNEIFIGITNESNVWYQDLAIVRPHSYMPKNSRSEIKIIDDKFDVLVYADSDNEDYTNKFTIDLYKESAI